MLQTIYTLVVIGTMALLHIFSAAKTEERKQPTRTRQPWEDLLESPSYQAISSRIRQVATRDATTYNYARAASVYMPRAPPDPVPVAYRVPQRATSVPRAPLTPAGTLPTSRCINCSICMDDSNNSLPACRIGMCGHVFHTGCLRPWLATNPTCPNCRAAV